MNNDRNLARLTFALLAVLAIPGAAMAGECADADSPRATYERFAETYGVDTPEGALECFTEVVQQALVFRLFIKSVMFLAHEEEHAALRNMLADRELMPRSDGDWEDGSVSGEELNARVRRQRSELFAELMAYFAGWAERTGKPPIMPEFGELRQLEVTDLAATGLARISVSGEASDVEVRFARVGERWFLDRDLINLE